MDLGFTYEYEILVVEIIINVFFVYMLYQSSLDVYQLRKVKFLIRIGHILFNIIYLYFEKSNRFTLFLLTQCRK